MLSSGSVCTDGVENKFLEGHIFSMGDTVNRGIEIQCNSTLVGFIKPDCIDLFIIRGSSQVSSIKSGGLCTLEMGFSRDSRHHQSPKRRFMITEVGLQYLWQRCKKQPRGHELPCSLMTGKRPRTTAPQTSGTPLMSFTGICNSIIRFREKPGE